jgi:hypothetical protein
MHSVTVLAYPPKDSSSQWDGKQYSRVLGLEAEDEVGQRVAEANSQHSTLHLVHGGVKHVLEMMRYLEVWPDVRYLYL